MIVREAFIMKKIIPIVIATLSICSCRFNMNDDYNGVKGKKVSQEEFISEAKHVNYKRETHYIENYIIDGEIKIICTDEKNGKELTNGSAKFRIESKKEEKDPSYEFNYSGSFPLFRTDEGIDDSLVNEEKRDEYIGLIIVFGRSLTNSKDFVYDYVTSFSQSSNEVVNFYIKPFQIETIDKESIDENKEPTVHTIATYDNNGIASSYHFCSAGKSVIVDEKNYVDITANTRVISLYKYKIEVAEGLKQ